MQVAVQKHYFRQLRTCARDVEVPRPRRDETRPRHLKITSRDRDIRLDSQDHIPESLLHVYKTHSYIITIGRARRRAEQRWFKSVCVNERDPAPIYAKHHSKGLFRRSLNTNFGLEDRDGVKTAQL